MKITANSGWRTSAAWTGFLLLLFAGCYVLIPQLVSFATTYSDIRQAQLSYLLLGLSAALLTYPFAALTYQYLAIRQLTFMTTLLVQFAGSFANRVIPAGAGALTFNYRFLRRNKHSPAQAGVVVIMNNILGFISACILCVFAVPFISRRQIHAVHLHAHSAQRSFVVLAVLACLLSIAIVLSYWKRHEIARIARQQKVSLAIYLQKPQKLLLACSTAFLLSLLYVTTLWLAGHALHVLVSFPQAIVAMALSTFGSVVLPTPGGVGGAETALVAALVLFGVPAASALAVALVYRLFTFWLPLLIGGSLLRSALKYL